jgi:hypothetical protein
MNGCSRSCVQLAEIEAMRSMTHAGRQKDNQANDRAQFTPWRNLLVPKWHAFFV